MVAGLESITAGEISIGGRVVNSWKPKDRDIAMVFQNYALYPHMSVYDNIAYGLRIRAFRKADIDGRSPGADLLGDRAFLDRKAARPFRRQRQRVAMGRAIVREPAVFLVDEPSVQSGCETSHADAGGNPPSASPPGITSLYVTHDQVEAMTLADRLMVMNAGVAEQVGTPMEIYHRPASTFVAGFIGSPAMNFLGGRIAAGGKGVELPGGTMLAPSRLLGSAGDRSRPVFARSS
jgi:sn-glycerol 3-phosphate transport system ATP-binding protein